MDRHVWIESDRHNYQMGKACVWEGEDANRLVFLFKAVAEQALAAAHELMSARHGISIAGEDAHMSLDQFSLQSRKSSGSRSSVPVANTSFRPSKELPLLCRRL